jgi:hypothetical protein
MASFTERMIGAAKLDVNTYEEVEADTTATGQAMAVVVISAVAAGLGSLGEGGVAGLIAGSIVSLIAWFIWAFVIFVVGTKLLAEPQTKSDVGELLRTIGFAQSPGVLYVLGAVPIIGGLVKFALWIWLVIAGVIAVRQALDYNSTGRAVLVVVIGFIPYVLAWLVLLGIIVAALGGLMAAGGAAGGG